MLTQRKGVVKSIISGDTVVIRGQPKNGPPPEKHVTLLYIFAPKIGRQPTNGKEYKDEPWGWESREFLRLNLIGKEVIFTSEKILNSQREYGTVLLLTENGYENVTDLIVAAGLAYVRHDTPRCSPDYFRLLEIEKTAKLNRVGMYSNSPAFEHVRTVHWAVDDASKILQKYGERPIKAIIEHVRNGSTFRLFLLPDFQFITLMLSGIRAPVAKLNADGSQEISEFYEESRYFSECRLLQRDVEVILESNVNKNFVGSILYHKGNIAEALLREGLAKCADWRTIQDLPNVDDLQEAERRAKENRLRLWKNYIPNFNLLTEKDRYIQGPVIQIFYGDSIAVRTSEHEVKKVFFSSIRPPRQDIKYSDEEDGVKSADGYKNFHPIYNTPLMFQTREFLRRLLINKKVTCTLDYIVNLKENTRKYYYTVIMRNQNVAEMLVERGLSTVVKYQPCDSQRSTRYEELKAAELRAQAAQLGIHNKVIPAAGHVVDLTADHTRVKLHYLQMFKRAKRLDAVVEYVASGSRFLLYIPEHNCLVTYSLTCIMCPRPTNVQTSTTINDTDICAYKALEFSKSRIFQRDVQIHIEEIGKGKTSVIGWLWIGKINLSVALVQAGLAGIHFSAKKSSYYLELQQAENYAKLNKLNLWENHILDEETEPPKDKFLYNYTNKYDCVTITEVTQGLTFFAQYYQNSDKFETLMYLFREEFRKNPISRLVKPRKDNLCASIFNADKKWYRAKIEKIEKNGQTVISYIDYGNKDRVHLSHLAALPEMAILDEPYAFKFALALIASSPEEEDQYEAYRIFADVVLNKRLYIKIEFQHEDTVYASIHNEHQVDIGKELLRAGLVLVDMRFTKHRLLQYLYEEYKNAELEAKQLRRGIWVYGDIAPDVPQMHNF